MFRRKYLIRFKVLVALMIGSPILLSAPLELCTKKVLSSLSEEAEKSGRCKDIYHHKVMKIRGGPFNRSLKLICHSFWKDQARRAQRICSSKKKIKTLSEKVSLLEGIRKQEALYALSDEINLIARESAKGLSAGVMASELATNGLPASINNYRSKLVLDQKKNKKLKWEGAVKKAANIEQENSLLLSFNRELKELANKASFYSNLFVADLVKFDLLKSSINKIEKKTFKKIKEFVLLESRKKRGRERASFKLTDDLSKEISELINLLNQLSSDQIQRYDLSSLKSQKNKEKNLLLYNAKIMGIKSVTHLLSESIEHKIAHSPLLKKSLLPIVMNNLQSSVRPGVFASLISIGFTAAGQGLVAGVTGCMMGGVSAYAQSKNKKAVIKACSKSLVLSALLAPFGWWGVAGYGVYLGAKKVRKTHFYAKQRFSLFNRRLKLLKIRPLILSDYAVYRLYN